MVGVERSGMLDDPKYIEGLPEDHVMRRNENVFGFSVGCAGLELAQFICMISAPGGIPDPGPQRYNISTGTIDRIEAGCVVNCPYTNDLNSLGDDVPVRAVGRHEIAEQERADRVHILTKIFGIRLSRKILHR
jgi:hypothetical protein